MWHGDMKWGNAVGTMVPKTQGWHRPSTCKNKTKHYLWSAIKWGMHEVEQKLGKK